MSIPNGQAQMEQSIRDSLAELERRQGNSLCTYCLIHIYASYN